MKTATEDSLETISLQEDPAYCRACQKFSDIHAQLSSAKDEQSRIEAKLTDGRSHDRIHDQAMQLISDAESITNIDVDGLNSKLRELQARIPVLERAVRYQGQVVERLASEFSGRTAPTFIPKQRELTRAYLEMACGLSLAVQAEESFRFALEAKGIMLSSALAVGSFKWVGRLDDVHSCVRSAIREAVESGVITEKEAVHLIQTGKF